MKKQVLPLVEFSSFPSRLMARGHIGVFLFLGLALGLMNCAGTGKNGQPTNNTASPEVPQNDTSGLSPSEADELPEQKAEKNQLTAMDSALLAMGLVEVAAIDTSIQVKLAYSTPDNFLGEDIYGDLEKCYLQKEVADKLIKAHQTLKSRDPRLRFLIYDGVRPLSVQQKMWNLVKGTEKSMYVSSPGSGSLHNFGCAVDLTVVSLDTGVLDMGTSFDFFGPEAQPRLEQEMLAAGKLTPAQVSNRRYLSQAMQAGGFSRLLTEWWHFNAFSREEAAFRYKIVP